MRTLENRRRTMMPKVQLPKFATYGPIWFSESPRTYTRVSTVRVVSTYPTRLDADLAKISLDVAQIPSVVVGVGLDFEGGASGVQLLVPDEYLETAKTILERAASSEAD